ncbi:MAG: sigma-70 family RNA polymerase sigma factor [Pirellulaceae bacterium]
MNVAEGSISAHNSTSQSLLRRVKSQDHSAWARMVHIYGPLVYRWCRRAGVAAQDVEDISQNVFQAVALGIHKFHRDRSGDSFRGWLYGITRFKVMDHFRRQQKDPAPQGGSEFQDQLASIPAHETSAQRFPDDQSMAEDDGLQVLHATLELIRPDFAPHNWQAFWQAAIEQQSATDVAESLGMTPGAVRQARYRVLRRLRQELDELQDL